MNPNPTRPPHANIAHLHRDRILPQALLLIVVLGSTLGYVNADHIRGGSLASTTYGANNPSGFSLQIAVNRGGGDYTSNSSYDGFPVVGETFTPAALENAQFDYGDGSPKLTSLAFTVSRFSSSGDWMIAIATIPPHTYSSAGPYTASFTALNRIANIENRSQLPFRLETVVRHISGQQVSYSPVIKDLVGGVYVVPKTTGSTQFTIRGNLPNSYPTFTYRLATPAEAGGGSAPPGLTIDSAGIVTWNNTASLNNGCYYTLQVVATRTDQPSPAMKCVSDILLKIEDIAITDLGAVDGGASAAFDVGAQLNPFGSLSVFGASTKASGSVAVEFATGGFGSSELGFPSPSVVNSINDLGGQVVGTFPGPGNTTLSFFKTFSGFLTLGNIFGGASTYLTCVNNNDGDPGDNTGGGLCQMAGKTQLANGSWRAFRLNNDETIQDLGTLPSGGNSGITCINDAGIVAGWAVNSAGSTRAVKKLTFASAGLSDLGSLGGPNSYGTAYGINNAGQVVGESTTFSGKNHAFCTLRGNVPLTSADPTDLGVLAAGANELSSARAVNNHGHVVGYSNDSSGIPRAMLWQFDGVSWTKIDLTARLQSVGIQGWTRLSIAHSISDLGHIVGVGITASGQQHAFLFRWYQGNNCGD